MSGLTKSTYQELRQSPGLLQASNVPFYFVAIPPEQRYLAVITFEKNR